MKICWVCRYVATGVFNSKNTLITNCLSNLCRRRERLDQIRKLFFLCYCQSIGHNLKDGSKGLGISYLFCNIAGKIMKSWLTRSLCLNQVNVFLNFAVDCGYLFFNLTNLFVLWYSVNIMGFSSKQISYQNELLFLVHI